MTPKKILLQQNTTRYLQTEIPIIWDPTHLVLVIKNRMVVNNILKLLYIVLVDCLKIIIKNFFIKMFSFFILLLFTDS